MVRKLIKYDMKAFAKVMFPIEIVLLGVALVYRLVSFFETDNISFEIFNVSAIVIFVVSIITACIMTFVYSIVRFYKNLFTQEGYLSFTLPVTSTAHIASKLIVSLIFDAITIVTALAAFCIATSGDVLVEVTKAGAFLFGKAVSIVGGDIYAYIVEAIFLFIAAVATQHVLTYMCISIGQTAKKHKILPAVGLYFAVYVAKQILGTTFISIGVSGDLFDRIAEFISKNPRESVHLFLLISLAIELVLGTVYFIITRLMMKKKLNLE